MNHSSVTTTTLAVLLIQAMTSCGQDSATPPSTFSVRDSAGVTIYESTAPAWAPGEEWSVVAEPVVHIGVIDGREEYQFTTIAGVWRVPDGGFVVADVQSAEIRFFDAGGIFRGSFGSPGEGPDEFQRLVTAYAYRGDSIAVWDARRRLKVFDGDGRLGRSVPFSVTPPMPPPGSPRVGLVVGGLNGAFPDGTFLVYPGTTFPLTPGERIPQGVAFLRYSAEGDSLQSVGPFSGPEVMIPEPGAGGVRLVSPFPRQVVSFPGRTGTFVGASEDFEVQRFRSDGVLDLLIRASHRSLTLTQAHRDIFEDRERRRLAESASPQALARALATVEFPETVPPYSQLLVDSEDHLWVRDYKMSDTPGPEVWSVFSPEGQLLGTLETPERFEVRQIGANFMVGIWTDELDVRYVRMYGLDRGVSVGINIPRGP